MFMRKSGFVFILCILFVWAVSCVGEKYLRPYTPGVYCDEEAFNDHKNLWDGSSVKNYTYTLCYDSFPPQNYTVAVTVSDGSVSEWVLKKYSGKEEITEEEKKEFESFLEDNKDFLLIESVYELFSACISEAYNKYTEYSDCYYSSFDFSFSEEVPFISYCKNTSLLMKEDVDGNGGYVEIQIKDFKPQ
ncbi:MAG: hypothetical protein J1F14_02550 [Treponema sp.]|nr:hypothetical protein [Treponema sp.]